MESTKLGFATTCNKGFSITFDNGVTVSVQFGPGNYCSNHNLNYNPFIELRNCQSPNAEIAIWDKTGEFITKEFENNLNDDVIGYLKPDRVLDALNWAKNYKS